MWGVDFTGGKVYFRNDVTNWTTSNIQIFAHQSGYTWVSPSMSAVSNTKLYYVNASCNWGGFVSYRICGNSSAWGSGSFTNENGSTKYTGANSSYGLNSGSIYLITPGNANNGCTISPQYYSSNSDFLTYTATAKVKTSTNGSSYTTLTSGAWPATVNIKGTYLSGDGATTRSDAATSSGASGTYNAVATGLITMSYSSLSSNYVFAGWGTGDTPSSTSESYEYNIGAATTVYAFFKKKHTVTFNANGHGTAPSAQTIVAGGLVTQPAAPTASGWTFGGWYKEAGCTNAWNFSSDKVTAATTLYAKWTQDPGVSLTASKTTINIGETITLTATGANASNITKYEFYEGSTKINTATTSNTSATYSYKPTTVGNKTLKVMMTYNSGSNTVTSSNVTLTISTPSVATLTEAGSTTEMWIGVNPTSALTFSATSGNVNSGASVTWSISDASSGTFTQTSAGSYSGKSWTYTPTSTGAKTITVTMTVGGQNYTKTYSLTVYERWNIYVQNNCSWPNGIALYMFNNGTNASWPGVSGTGTGCEVYAGNWYVVTLDSKYPNFILNKNANGEQTNDCTTGSRTGTYAADTYWYFNYDHDYDGVKYYNLTKNTSLADPTVSIETGESASYMVNTTMLFATGHITNYGGDGSRPGDMLEVGFKIGSTEYPMSCMDTDNDYFWGYITGLTPGTAYTVKAYAKNIHGTGTSSNSKSLTTRASSSYTIKVEVNHGATAPYIYAYTDANTCEGALVENATWPGVQLATKAITGTLKDWWTYSMPTTYNNFIISNGTSAKQSKVFTAPQEDKCYWYDPNGATDNDRADEMTCPYTTPQLMINTPGAPTTYTYYEMSTSPSISKTMTLVANSTYKFKIVYGSEWYGKASTTLTRASNSITGADAASGDNREIQLNTDIAGSYTFTFTAPGTITVTYPTAYTVTYNANNADGGSIPDVSGSYYASGSNVTLATNTGILYKTGNAFNGWNTLSGGGGTHYASGGTLTGISGNVTLYAEWKANDNHMYFYNKDNWPAVAAYMWKHIAPSVNDPERTYPGRTMTLHQGKVYKIDYRSDVQDSVVFNNGNTGSGNQTGDIKIADGQSGDHWFYNDADKSVNTGGIHHGWSQYIMVAEFPTSTVAAVVGERITLSPVLAWAEDVTFNDIEITSTRTSGNASVNAIISGTNIIVSGTTANTSATFTITYRYSTTTITKTLTVNIKNGIVIQSKVPQDDNHWVYSNVMKLHYWGTGISDGDVTMAWVKADNDYTYFQTFVPLGTDNKINFLFYYDYMNMSEMWRQTTNITNVTTAGCYEIKHNNGLDAQRTWARSGDNCVDTWQVEITMGSGDIFTSNVVDNSTDIISFFAPSNANESHTYRQGVVTLEHNGATVATIPAATFTQSGVYTAKVNTSTPGLTNVALYTGNYYIRTDASHGGWDNYKTDPLNKMTNFNRNANFPNETFSYYWVDNVAKTPGDPVNIKATVANDYNPVLTNFSIDESVAREEHGINLRFGYEPTTNELVRGILRGSNENNFLNVIGTTGNIYRDATRTTLMDESQYSSDPSYLKMQDKSNWVYEITAYATIDNTHRGANVYLKSYYGGVHYLLGMVKDADGRDTDVPISLSVIVPGTTIDITYTLRVIYDFKTNRLFAAWAPANISVSSNMNVDADVMFLRHEQGDVAQISFANTSAEITHLNKAIFAVEIADDRSTSLGNRELHYFFSLPFDCYVKDIFGIGGFMKYWGIQYYDGAERARIGWFVETPTFWKWLGENDLLEAGKGYLLSIDKYALQDDDQWKSVNAMELEGGVWVDKGVKSILTLYFPSAGSGFSMGSATATGATKVITYPNEPCSIKRDDRDQKDSNWKCIGTPGYKNMTMTGYTADPANPPYWGENTPPKFLYEFIEQTESVPYAKGKYTVVDGSTFTYHAFHSYMVQYAGTINWGDYSAGNGPSHIVARRAPQNEMSQATNVEIDLLSEDSTSLDRTFVWLREDATAGYDQNYDLNKMVESYANQIYSLSDHDIPFAANVMPYETDTVRLVVNIVNPGEFTFSMLKDEHFGLTPILYDMYKSEQIDLTSADYTVELDYGKYTDRFFLLFSPVKPVATAIETTEDGTQNVLSGEAIYDVLGRRVSTVTPGHLYIVNGEKRIAQ